MPSGSFAPPMRTASGSLLPPSLAGLRPTPRANKETFTFPAPLPPPLNKKNCVFSFCVNTTCMRACSGSKSAGGTGDTIATAIHIARHVFHDQACCAADGWIFSAGESDDPNARLLGTAVQVDGSDGTIWCYHPRHQIWKVKVEPFDLLNFQDIDEQDFAHLGIQRIQDGVFRVRNLGAEPSRGRKRPRAEADLTEIPSHGLALVSGSGVDGVPWPARVLSMDEVRNYHTLGVLPANFPRTPAEIAVVVFFPARYSKLDFWIKVATAFEVHPVPTSEAPRSPRGTMMQTRFHQGMKLISILTQYATENNLKPPDLTPFNTHVLHPAQCVAPTFPEEVLNVAWADILQEPLDSVKIDLPSVDRCAAPPGPRECSGHFMKGANSQRRPRSHSRPTSPASSSSAAPPGGPPIGSASSPAVAPRSESERPMEPKKTRPATGAQRSPGGRVLLGASSDEASSSALSPGDTQEQRSPVASVMRPQTAGLDGRIGGSDRSPSSGASPRRMDHRHPEDTAAPESDLPRTCVVDRVSAEDPVSEPRGLEEELEYIAAWTAVWSKLLEEEQQAKTVARDIYHLCAEQELGPEHFRMATDNVRDVLRQVDAARRRFRQALVRAVESNCFRLAGSLVRLAGLCDSQPELDELADRALAANDRAKAAQITEIIRQAKPDAPSSSAPLAALFQAPNATLLHQAHARVFERSFEQNARAAASIGFDWHRKQRDPGVLSQRTIQPAASMPRPPAETQAVQTQEAHAAKVMSEATELAACGPRAAGSLEQEGTSSGG